MNPELDFYTFDRGRQCHYCKKKIADQVHKTRIFCEREVLPDGSVKSCKDDFNAIRRNARNLPYRRIMNHYKEMDTQIKRLLDEHDEKVNRELINRYGIILQRPLEFEVDNKNGLYTFYFTRYALKQIGDSEYKILKHGRLF